MLGALHILYAEVLQDQTGSSDDFRLSPAEWRAMRRSNLFTNDEVRRLEEHPANKPMLAASWAMGEVKAALVRESAPQESSSRGTSPYDVLLNAMPPLTVLKAFEDVSSEFCVNCHSTVETLRQQVPFACTRSVAVNAVLKGAR
jgi:hypothetical protein